MWTTDELRKFLSKVKIKEEFIIIHSDISGLTFPNFNLPKLWNMIFHSFGKDKTYIFPAFSFKDEEIKNWSYKHTRSEAGILSEYFRKKISSVRTIHPIHSVSIFGKNKTKIPIKYSSSSFGKNSFWEWACNNKNVCNISMGLKLDGGATFCHYSEEFCKVPYRNFIDLNCSVRDKKNIPIKKKFRYFARNLSYKKKPINDWDRVQNELKNKNLLKIYKNVSPQYQIIKMNTFKVSNFLIKNIKKDDNFLLKSSMKQNN